jgi:hypothetical protein
LNGQYGFLDEMQEREIETLKCCVSARKMPGKKGQKKQKRLGITMGGVAQHLLQEQAKCKRAGIVWAARHMVKERLKKDVG